jgi:two-component sensor histidine kinase
MLKRLQRGKGALGALGASLTMAGAELGVHLEAVHQGLYLMFNEGYHGSSADEPVRDELCYEALRLGEIEGLEQCVGAALAGHPAQAEQTGQQDEVFPAGEILVHGGELTGQADAGAHGVGMRLNDEQLGVIDELRAMCKVVPPTFLDSPLDRADRVDALTEWMDAHGGDVDQAGPLAETAVTVDGLNKLASVLSGEALEDAVRWLAACCVVRSASRELQESTRRISDLVASVKGFTYMGRASVPEPVDVARGLNDTARIVGSKARDKSVTVTIDVEPDLPAARAFGSELNQIWINLIENALDAVSYGGEVVVSARREFDWVVVRVVDNGEGIPPDIKDRIFDPFFTTKAVGEGTGMGLDIVRRLVFKQSGEIDVDSRSGRTEFRVAIPIAGPTTGTFLVPEPVPTAQT